jgi:AraC-like DNA-binding protein
MNNHMLSNDRHNFSELAVLKTENLDFHPFKRNVKYTKIEFSTSICAIKSENVDWMINHSKFIDDLRDSFKERLIEGSLDLNQFAVEMNMSKSTLQRKINQFVGLSPCRLLNSYRIEIAKQLLYDNSLNISEVAYKIGFNDPRYFSRCFKNELGMSPKKYREMNIQSSFLNENNKSNDSFLDKAILKLEMRMSDGDLTLDQFAIDMNVSKASLYRKLKTVAGKSPCKFIRSVRIRHSAQLLAKHNNISEVAFAVGFNDSKYFSRCFKREFGVAPKKYQELLAC